MEAMPLDSSPRPLGHSGISVFPIAYGCWRFAGTNVSEARRKIDAALDAGFTLFDHADIYGGDGAAETLFGQALAEARALRERMNISTKCGIIVGVPYDSSAAHIQAACEASLRRLRIDVIDLYQIHRPDLLAHPEEIARALAGLRAVGKIREVGVSNYTVAQTRAIQSFLPFPLATTQPEVSAWWLEAFRDGTFDHAMSERLTPLAWSPLAGGKLGMAADEAKTETNGSRLAVLIETLDRIAVRDGVPRSAVALAFLLVHPSRMIPIVGTQRVERIQEALQAFRVRLTRRDWYAVFAASQGKPMP